MSSATSIEPELPVADPGTSPAARAHDARPRDTLQPWHFFLLLSLVGATVAVVLARQSRPEHLVVISLTIGAAGFAAGALYRTLLPLVSEPTRTDVAPLSESRRAALQREKALVLRSIKELEFDRAMGKVSAKDVEDMAGRLRARAMSLMRQLDAGSAYREMIERELALRVKRRGAPSAVRTTTQESASARTCACACGTANDPDAAFCKRCGSRLAQAVRS